MITRDDIVRKYLQLNTRRFYSRILCNGAEIDGSVRSWTVSKGSCGSGSFRPQSVFSNYADISIDNCTMPLKGKKIQVQIGINATGTISWYTIATLYVKNAPIKGTSTSIEALGVMSAKLGTKFYGSSYTTVSALLGRIAEVAGVNISLGAGLEDLEIPAIDLSNYLYREILSMVSGLYFGYCTETADGNIEIRSYKSIDAVVPAYLSRMADYPDLYEEATVEGIQVINADDKELLVGNLQNCSLTNPLMTAEAFNKYCTNYVGFTYQAHSTTLTLGDFTLEPNDYLSIEDKNGVVHELPCMFIKHIYDGGLKTIVSAPTISSGEDMAREETTMHANTAYNSLITGNFESGEVKPNPTVLKFDIAGDNISNGFGWTETGEMYFINFDLTCPTVPSYVTGAGGSMSGGNVISYAQCEGSGIMGMTGIVPLGLQFINGVLPVFYNNGSEYCGAGGLAYSVRLDIKADGTFNWVLYLQFTTTYVESNIGNLYTKDINGGYRLITAGTVLPVKTFFLASSESQETQEV